MKRSTFQKSSRRTAVAIVLAIVFSVSAAPLQIEASSTQERLDQAEEERDKAQQGLEETEGEKTDLETKTNTLKGTLDNLNAELTQVSTNLEDLEQEITGKKEDIVQTEANLAEAIATREEQYKAMKLRIKFLYESRDYFLLETLFGSANFSDFLNRNEYIEQLAEYDQKKLVEFKESERQVEQKKAQLLTEKEDLDDLLIQVQAEQARVAGLVGQTSGVISDYKEQISQAEQEMLAYEQQIKEKNESIEQLQKQLEEERRLARLSAQTVWRNLSDVTFADGERYLLANLIYCEAGNQPYEGQVAVGAVVINRVLSHAFPDTVTGVIYQNKQFSPVASGRLALALAENRATPNCYKAADAAMSGASTVGSCLFFRTPIEGLSGISIGGHIFYTPAT